MIRVPITMAALAVVVFLIGLAEASSNTRVAAKNLGVDLTIERR